MNRHPIQPLHHDGRGTLRFKENAIVRFLLDAGPFDMNMLAAMDFSSEDREQFAQLIGYSLGGFGELSYVSDETYNTAERMADGASEDRARIKALEAVLEKVRDGLKVVVPAVFKIHPDDLDC
jgi:hypothetical protein